MILVISIISIIGIIGSLIVHLCVMCCMILNLSATPPLDNTFQSSTELKKQNCKGKTGKALGGGYKEDLGGAQPPQRRRRRDPFSGQQRGGEGGPRKPRGWGSAQAALIFLGHQGQ